MSEPVHRRAFLEAALSLLATTPRWASALGPALGLLACDVNRSSPPFSFDSLPSSPLPPPPPPESLTIEGFAWAFFPEGSADALRTLGERYLELVAPEASEDTIEALLAPTAALLQGNDAASAIDALRGKVEDDFAQGNDLTLEGWILATTELQLCALVHRALQVIQEQ